MSLFLNKDNILPVLVVSFIIGGVALGSTVATHTVKIDRLEKNQMTREVIEVQLSNIEDKLDDNNVKTELFYAKLLEHIQDTK